MSCILEPEGEQTICIDIDGVVTDPDNCPEHCDFTDTDVLIQWDKCPMRPGADKFVRLLKESYGYRIVFYTGREEVDREPTEEWLKRHNIPFDELVMGKPRAMVYIDDLAYRFSGREFHAWDNVIRFIRMVDK